MKVGLFFGSFNPVHIGHMAIANYVLSFTDLDQVWFVVSPQNPFKEKKQLLPDYQRYELVLRAIGDHPRMQVSNIEFGMPQPSYTIDTLVRLVEKYPKNEFVLIMGADNVVSFHKWKNWEVILAYHRLMVYPRPGVDTELLLPAIRERMRLVSAPLMEVSSSFIRQSIAQGYDVRFFMPSAVHTFVDEMNFYKPTKP